MGKRIMVVDDSSMDELIVAELLEDTDYEIAAHCKSGQEALGRFDEVMPDLVTMDIIMPGMDGLETAQAILERHPDARIIIISSLAYDDTIDEAKRVGAKCFIYKPLDRDVLLDAFEKALADED